MTTPEERLADLGLTLPAPINVPAGLHLPFTFINVRGNRALISGHPAQDASGAIAGPYGKLGADLTTEQGYAAARDIGLSVLANLKAEIGALSRVAGWTRVYGFSDLIVDVFGAEIGRHARSAIGVANLPMNFAIEIEGEVLLRDG